MAFGIFEATLVFVFVGVVSGLIWFELKVLRTRRVKGAGRSELSEQSHNALVTTRAIRDALAGNKVTNAEADVILLRADGAHARGAYKQAVELCADARELLIQERIRSQQRGELSRLERMGGSEEETPKEKLARETPPNFMQARFTLNLVRDSIEQARNQGHAVAPAEAALQSAQEAFDAGAYEDALKQGLRAKRAADDSLPPDVQVDVEGGQERPRPAAPSQVTPGPAPSPASAGLACPQCKAPASPDDDFCRKCGTRLPRPHPCAQCGSPVKADDAFCRKCGTKAEPKA
jgi:ribosomal protein L40E